MSPPYGHSMLPNDHHPGQGCSCADCLRSYPEPTTDPQDEYERYIARLDKARAWPQADNE